MLFKAIHGSYHPSYLSIDSILAAEMPINCRTVKRIPKFGFLVPEYMSEDLPEDVDFQLPLWACRSLSNKRGRAYVTVTLPAGLTAVYWDLRKTTVANTNVKAVHSHYYEAAQLCTSLFHPETVELSQVIPELLFQRILSIGASTIPFSCPRWVSNDFDREMIPVQFMDILEYNLFQCSRQASVNIEQWLEPLISPPQEQEIQI